MAMTEALFQHIPRCLFEPIALLGAAGVVIFLIRHWKKAKCETILLGGAFLGMLIWRLVLPIAVDRYALILIPVAIFASLSAIEAIADLCRRYCSRFPGTQLFFVLLLIVCLVKSFHGSTEDRLMFDLMEALKTDAGEPDRKLRVTANRDLSCFLGDGFEVQMCGTHPVLPLAALPAADYYLLKLKTLPPDCGNPQFVRLRELRQVPHGKSSFLLWKRVRRK